MALLVGLIVKYDVKKDQMKRGTKCQHFLKYGDQNCVKKKRGTKITDFVK
jgi:hypothetical protein